MIKKKYVTEVNFYSIVISAESLFDYKENLRGNKPLTPEIVGFLLGKADPIRSKVRCEICKKFILEKERQVKKEHGYYGSVPIHKKCFKKVYKKAVKGSRGLCY